MGSWVSDRHGSSARRSVGHWRGHHGGCLLDFVCLGCVKCDLWLGRWLICGGGQWLGVCSVSVFFFFFFVAVVDIGGGGG